MRRTVYPDIYEVVRRIPRGKVASYGQIAKLTGRCTARMVGYAMAATPAGSDIPWHRVVNGQGRISPRQHGDGAECQRHLLESEGVIFDPRDRIDLLQFGWDPPDPLVSG